MEAVKRTGPTGESVNSGLAVRRRDRRLAWIAVSAIVLSVSTLLAVHQSPRADPYETPARFGLDWFVHPIELAAEQRLPAVAGEVRALWSSDDGERVWAVGDGGLILKSVDGGRRWEPVALRRAAGGGATGAGDAEAGRKATSPIWPLQLPGGSAAAQAGPERFDPPQQEIPEALGAVPDGDDGSGAPTETDAPPEQRVADPAAADLRPLPGSRQEADAVATLATEVDWSAAVAFTTPREEPVANLESVHFLAADGRYGWIGGGEGTLLRTLDGGETWEERVSMPPPGEGFRRLFFDSADDGCALLGSGFAAATSDGGVSWKIGGAGPGAGRDPGCPDWKRAVDPRDGAGRLRSAFELWAEDQGLPSHPPPVVVPFAGLGAWAVAGGGVLASTHDEGATWRLTTRSAHFGIRSLYFLDERRGFAGFAGPGGSGSVEVTEDGGRTWRTVLPGLEGAVVDLDLSALRGGGDGRILRALTSAGALYESDDLGESWRRIPAGYIDALRLVDVEFANESDGIGVIEVSGDTRFRAFTQDRGVDWTLGFAAPYVRQVVASEGATTEAPPPGAHDWYLDETGTFVMADDNSVRYGPLPFVGRLQKRGDLLWLGGSAGLARSSLVGAEPDRELDWEPLTDASPVSAFFFLDDQHGWRAEPGGGLLATIDGGSTWADLTPHAIRPAPWYWLAVLAGVLFLVPAVAPPPAERIERSIAEIAVSDRPIGPGDPDPLGFERVARGLSRFLRNAATRPPLTIAVVGEWGTGKSSLMNLVKADLEGYGFRPVWFNAWHHQKEEQLLAALLENIRRQAVPSWFRPEGWIFRGRLLGERLRRWFVPALAGIAAFGVATGWVIARGNGGLDGLQAAVELPFTYVERLLPNLGDGEVPAPAEGAQPIFFGWLLSAVGVAVTLLRGLRAFGLKPAQLAAGLSEHARVRDIEAQTGFRYRFAREFADVTRALSPRTLTVMIDDLDRCQPQNVLEVLEAINFLVSSGECYLLLGIDRERVERCVGYGFRDVAEEILDRDAARDEEATGEEPAATEPPEEAGRRRRAAFARQYLEKLINIEVSVPRAAEETGVELLRPVSSPSVPPSRRRRLLGWARRQSGRWWLLPATLGGALAGGLLLGIAQQEASEPPAQQGVEVAEGTIGPEPTSGEDPSPREPVAGEADTGEPDRRSPQPAGFAPGRAAERSQLGLWGLAALLVVGVGLWTLTTLPQVEVHDSPEFLDALVAWYPLLHSTSPTPRSTKRFLNRVRFYAMGQRAVEPPHSRFDGLLARRPRWLRRRRGAGVAASGPRPDVTGEEGSIPEEVLVGLTAVQHTHPEWLAEDRFWTSPSTFLAGRVTADLPLAFWQRYRGTFERLSRGVETR
jgi:photosystem II stability/assembly factor-like uncharacterized protein